MIKLPQKQSLEEHLTKAYEEDALFQKVLEQLKRKVKITLSVLLAGGFLLYAYLYHQYTETLQREKSKYEYLLYNLQEEIERKADEKFQEKLRNPAYRKRIVQEVKQEYEHSLQQAYQAIAELKSELQQTKQQANHVISQLEKKIEKTRKQHASSYSSPRNPARKYAMKKMMERYFGQKQQPFSFQQKPSSFSYEQPLHPESYYYRNIPELYRNTGYLITISDERWTLEQLSLKYTGERYLWKYFLKYDTPQSNNKKIRQRGYKLHRGDVIYIPYAFLTKKYKEKFRREFNLRFFKAPE